MALCVLLLSPGLSVRIERYQKKTEGVAQLGEYLPRMQQNWFYPQSSHLSCCQDSPFTDGKLKHGKQGFIQVRPADKSQGQLAHTG